MDYTIAKQDDVYTFTITRPEKRNAISPEVINGLETVIGMVEADKNAKILYIKGEGDLAFCSGGDVAIFHSYSGAEIHHIFSKAATCLYRLATLPVLTIADLHGYTLGGGAELASAVDVRIARKGVKVGWIQGSIGITTAWGGATLLQQRVENGFCTKWLFSAALVPEEELVHSRFVHYFYDSTESRDQVIQRLESQAIGVIRGYKEGLVRKFSSSVLAEMQKEVERCSALWDTPFHREQVARFLAKEG